MTHTPSYGIWTTDLDGNRVVGFTPTQMLAVTQERDELLAALKAMVDSFDSKTQFSALVNASAAIQKATNKEQA